MVLIAFIPSEMRDCSYDSDDGQDHTLTRVAMHASPTPFKPKPKLKPWRWTWNGRLLSEPLYLFLYTMWSFVPHFFSLNFTSTCPGDQAWLTMAARAQDLTFVPVIISNHTACQRENVNILRGLVGKVKPWWAVSLILYRKSKQFLLKPFKQMWSCQSGPESV